VEKKKSDLVNRTRLGSAVDNGLLEKLRVLSKETKIPLSRLLDEAIELRINKHNDDEQAATKNEAI
jgi:hypothetical protein